MEALAAGIAGNYVEIPLAFSEILGKGFKPGGCVSSFKLQKAQMSDDLTTSRL